MLANQDNHSALSPQPTSDALVDALSYPTIIVEVGSAAILRTNQLAVDAGLLIAPMDGDIHAPFYQRSDGSNLPLEQSPLRRAAAGDEFRSERVVFVGPHGRVCFLVSSIAGPPAENGAAVRVVSFVDFTALETTERDLRQSLRGRDEFVSVATHELKEPLNSILLCLQYLDLMLRRSAALTADMIRPELALLQRQGRRLGQLVDNLLDVARINNNRLQLDREALDFCELVREVVERYREEIRIAGSTITVETCGSVIGYFDRIRLEQVVGNLVANAIKYGQGKPIEVRASAADDSVKLEVADRGIGIALADQARIFERFERAATGHRKMSLGLGLHIARSMVDAHGGTITLSSEPGNGSTFTVVLPRHQMDAADPASENSVCH